jgi:PAS domain S-box-containing protein
MSTAGFEAPAVVEPLDQTWWMQRLRPRQLAGGTGTVVLASLCVLALAAVSVGDAASSGSSTVGAIGVLPVGLAAWLLARRWIAGIVLFALFLRVLAWRMGNVSGLTCLSQSVVIGAVALAVRVAATSVRRAAVADALAAQAESARLILDSALDAVITMDSDGIVRGWSSPAEAMFGWSAEEVLGRPLVELIIPPAFRNAHLRGLARYRETGEAPVLGNVLSLSAVDRQGRQFPIELAISATSSNARQTTFIAFVRDISERRRSEEAVAHALAAAEAASEAKTEFLSRMSHELRTPLTAIIGFAGLLEMEQPRADQATAIQTILVAGDHLLAMIDQLLQISAIEAGQESLSLEPVRIDHVVEQCMDLVALAAANQGVTMHRELGGMAGATVLADRHRLEQVVLNLLSNAIKYNRRGGSVRVCVRHPSPGLVRLSVADTGDGIAADLLGRLFQPFDRLGAERTEVQGTGLGLALCKRLVDAMDGTIGVDSVAGEGATFWVELPRTEGRDAIDMPSETGADRGEGAMTTLQNILYVEDNLFNLELVERVLRHRPHVRVIPVMQGGLALELAAEQLPDLVLLDLQLADMEGLNVLRQLRADPRTSDTPVIMLSGGATKQQVSSLLAAGADAHLSKPIRVRELLVAVDAALSRSATRHRGRG